MCTSELATLDNEFFCLSDDGAMVFYAPVNGGTDGSTYSRSELREMVDTNSSNVGWVITGTHTMSATTTVTQEPSNGKNVIAQVDSLSDDILGKIQWDNDKIRAQLRQINPDGSPGSYENYWFDSQNASFPVGTQFSWEMTVKDGVLYVTVNGDTVEHDFTLLASSPSDYVDDEFYFSAGSQPQDNTQDDPEGEIEAGEVLFHTFGVIHAMPEIELPVGGASGYVGEGQTGAMTFDVTNSGGSGLAYSITEGSCAGAEDYAWLTSIAPATGVVEAGGTESITLDIDATGETNGSTLNGTVCINSNAPDGGRAVNEVAIVVNVTVPTVVNMSNSGTVTTMTWSIATAMLIVLLAVSTVVVMRRRQNEM